MLPSSEVLAQTEVWLCGNVSIWLLVLKQKSALRLLPHLCDMAKALRRVAPTIGLLKTQRRRTARRSVTAVRDGRAPGKSGPMRTVSGSKGAQFIFFDDHLDLNLMHRWIQWCKGRSFSGTASEACCNF
jgi:hypothetical protein